MLLCVISPFSGVALGVPHFLNESLDSNVSLPHLVKWKLTIDHSSISHICHRKSIR